MVCVCVLKMYSLLLTTPQLKLLTYINYIVLEVLTSAVSKRIISKLERDKDKD